jgi:hypothetical protein
MVDDTILTYLDSMVHIHCQFVSTGVHIQVMWTTSAAVSSQPATSSCSPLSLPFQHANTRLVTMWYGTACLPQVSCNHLRHCCAFLSTHNLDFNNTLPFTYLTHFWSNSMRHMTTDTTREHLKQIPESCQQTGTCNKESLLHKAHTFAR